MSNKRIDSNLRTSLNKSQANLEKKSEIGQLGQKKMQKLPSESKWKERTNDQRIGGKLRKKDRSEDWKKNLVKESGREKTTGFKEKQVGLLTDKKSEVKEKIPANWKKRQKNYGEKLEEKTPKKDRSEEWKKSFPTKLEGEKTDLKEEKVDSSKNKNNESNQPIKLEWKGRKKNYGEKIVDKKAPKKDRSEDWRKNWERDPGIEIKNSNFDVDFGMSDRNESFVKQIKEDIGNLDKEMERISKSSEYTPGEAHKILSDLKLHKGNLQIALILFNKGGGAGALEGLDFNKGARPILLQLNEQRKNKDIIMVLKNHSDIKGLLNEQLEGLNIEDKRAILGEIKNSAKDSKALALLNKIGINEAGQVVVKKPLKLILEAIKDFFASIFTPKTMTAEANRLIEELKALRIGDDYNIQQDEQIRLKMNELIIKAKALKKSDGITNLLNSETIGKLEGFQEQLKQLNPISNYGEEIPSDMSNPSLLQKEIDENTRKNNPLGNADAMKKPKANDQFWDSNPNFEDD